MSQPPADKPNPIPGLVGHAEPTGDRARVCVLGSLNMDLVVRAPRQPRPGETVIGGEFGRYPGGKGANQAVGAARLGASVAMIGAVGDDAFGREFLEVLRADGVDTRFIAVRPAPPAGPATGVGIITIDASPEGEGQNTIVVALGANASLRPEEVDAAKEAIAGADVLLTQLETPVATVVRAATIARECGTTVMLNAAPAPAAAALPPDLFASVDVLIVNEHEGAALCGPLVLDEKHRLQAQLASLSDRGPQCVVLTLGQAGAVVYYEGSSHPFAAAEVEAVDTVGAGDAFCAAMACRWSALLATGGIDSVGVMDAVAWGIAAGGVAVTRRGAIPSLPSRREVVEMLRRH